MSCFVKHVFSKAHKHRMIFKSSFEMTLNVLLFFLHQCGFFKRSKYEDSVPKYHAVRIRKETRLLKDGEDMLDPLEKKQWMTTWNENESYS